MIKSDILVVSKETIFHIYFHIIEILNVFEKFIDFNIFIKIKLFLF